MWGFHAVREKAIKNIASSPDIQPVDQVILAKKYDVPAWLMPALEKLARQDDPVGIDDSRRLSAVAGWEFALQLGHVRETYSAVATTKWSELGWGACNNCGNTIHTVRCASHNLQMTVPFPRTQNVVPWPCVTCTNYRCIYNNSYNWNKPTTVATGPRSSHDFKPAIQRIFSI
jgi:hypothetical protein